MNVHIVIDFSHIYYKYMFRMEKGNLKRLNAPVEQNGVMISKDISIIYYSLRDIEGIRRSLQNLGHTVTMSICFDMVSHRKDKDKDMAGSAEYKSNRVKHLNEDDYTDIQFIQSLLNIAGHNTYREDGYEADDLIHYLVTEYKNDFDYTVIYTNDKDLFTNICDNVGVMRYKITTGYSQVDKSNYEEYTLPEFKAHIPYNAISLYLSTVGDSSDVIKGINKFGPKAFDKLIDNLKSEDIDWSTCGDYNNMEIVIEKCKKYLNENQMEQLKNSFKLVQPYKLDKKLSVPDNISTLEKRKEAYEPYNMISLYP